ncbi:MAG: DUF3293 domain-containing protein [Wenzhouxiangella sp.]|nr:MAG: DUF3293 domain-containing protein [Wenzhouxiangella sp.]
MTESVLDRQLVELYRQADYRVDRGFVLRVDHPGVELARWHARQGVDCSAFVTACNPRGQQLDEQSNRRRTARLEAVLAESGRVFVPGVGQDPSGDWPGEASFLVAGLSLAAAQDLGRQFAQNAVVWSGEDAVPRLILLR